MSLASRALKINSKLIISIRYSKSVTHSVEHKSNPEYDNYLMSIKNRTRRIRRRVVVVVRRFLLVAFENVVGNSGAVR
jgi:hypothetical protein